MLPPEYLRDLLLKDLERNQRLLEGNALSEPGECKTLV